MIHPFQTAPVPTVDADSVISLFSDAYENVEVSFFNGYYEPYQTTISNDFSVNGDSILNYQNFNFVGIEFNPTTYSNPVPSVDASQMTHVHFDIYIPDEVPIGSNIRFNLIDFGQDDAFAGDDNSAINFVITEDTSPALVSGEWINVDVDITQLVNRKNLGQIVFDEDKMMIQDHQTFI